MKVFLASACTDFADCELISIALVAEDGREFHAERPDFRPVACCTRTAMLPHHRRRSGAFMSRGELALRLRAWLGTLPEIVIACESSYDWELFVDALDGASAPNVARWLRLGAFAVESDLAGVVVREPNGPWPRGDEALQGARARLARWEALNPARREGWRESAHGRYAEASLSNGVSQVRAVVDTRPLACGHAIEPDSS
jgi:hypothetical protein